MAQNSTEITLGSGSVLDETQHGAGRANEGQAESPRAAFQAGYCIAQASTGVARHVGVSIRAQGRPIVRHGADGLPASREGHQRRSGACGYRTWVSIQLPRLVQRKGVCT